MNPEETETRISESCNRSLRAALHKNSVEQTNCDSATRILDAQRKCAYSRLTREEQDVRQQLQLLQLEQKQLSDLATGSACGSDPSSPLGSDLSSIPDQRSVGPDEVVNPYPITSRSKTNSGPNPQPDQNTVGSSSLSSARCLTRDLSDLETTSRPWPGDLEAISSIRRALKPPCRQRIDQQQQQGSSWARSRSLKERPQSSALTRLHAMLRSKSLRGPDKARLSLSSPTAAAAASPVESGGGGGGGTCLRSGSLKDRAAQRQFRRRGDEVAAAPGHGQLRRSVSLKTKMSEPDYGGSREEERRVLRQD